MKPWIQLAAASVAGVLMVAGGPAWGAPPKPKSVTNKNFTYKFGVNKVFIANVSGDTMACETTDADGNCLKESTEPIAKAVTIASLGNLEPGYKLTPDGGLDEVYGSFTSNFLKIYSGAVSNSKNGVVHSVTIRPPSCPGVPADQVVANAWPYTVLGFGDVGTKKKPNFKKWNDPQLGASFVKTSADVRETTAKVTDPEVVKILGEEIPVLIVKATGKKTPTVRSKRGFTLTSTFGATGDPRKTKDGEEGLVMGLLDQVNKDACTGTVDVFVNEDT